ncbi:MAG TPA: hypothetical protein VGR73_05410 [Bryobacteraceae bacterium]|nr:hypothetical protein [Bryobacteraceae bacterium]
MLKHIRVAAVVFLLAHAAAAQSPAQNWNNVKALAAGTNVRVVSGSRTVSGQVQGVTDDSISVNSGKGPEMFARQEVTRVSVKTGHRGRHALIGLAIGAGAGLAIGAGLNAADSCKGTCFGPNVGGAVVGGFTAVGAIVGAVIGAAIPTGGWREVYRQ